MWYNSTSPILSEWVRVHQDEVQCTNLTVKHTLLTEIWRSMLCRFFTKRGYKKLSTRWVSTDCVKGFLPGRRYETPGALKPIARQKGSQTSHKTVRREPRISVQGVLRTTNIKKHKGNKASGLPPSTAHPEFLIKPTTSKGILTTSPPMVDLGHTFNSLHPTADTSYEQIRGNT